MTKLTNILIKHVYVVLMTIMCITADPRSSTSDHDNMKPFETLSSPYSRGVTHNKLFHTKECTIVTLRSFRQKNYIREISVYCYKCDSYSYALGISHTCCCVDIIIMCFELNVPRNANHDVRIRPRNIIMQINMYCNDHDRKVVRARSECEICCNCIPSIHKKHKQKIKNKNILQKYNISKVCIKFFIGIDQKLKKFSVISNVACPCKKTTWVCCCALDNLGQFQNEADIENMVENINVKIKFSVKKHRKYLSLRTEVYKGNMRYLNNIDHIIFDRKKWKKGNNFSYFTSISVMIMINTQTTLSKFQWLTQT